jgi:VIT1/CCC1 family predicted Fe2+/Mn2+ transporter
MTLDPDLKKGAVLAQKIEITEYIIYKKLAVRMLKGENKKIFEKLANDELGHYNTFKNVTGIDVPPDQFKVFFYVLLARLCGLTFGMKLMERGELLAQHVYLRLKEFDPRIEKILHEEEDHERQLISLIDEERLRYISSVVLGLNDALVELTGALVGLTLALQNPKLIAIIGFITGGAASMSMAASEYLSTKQEDTQKSHVKASVYTGVSYICTVLFLIFPYIVFSNIFVCLGLVLVNALLVILCFTYYISVAKDFSFKEKFFEMAGISLSVAAINFFVGLVIRKVFAIDV